MMKILIITEHDNQTLKLATLHTITAAKVLSDDIDLLVIGHECQSVAEVASKLMYVKRVLVADNAVYTHQLAENTAALIVDVSKDYDYILTGATTFGKNLLPRVA